MKDYNKDYSCGDIHRGLVNIVIEIPAGSTDKVEWNRLTKKMEVDRVEPSTFPVPENYGFIPQTMGGDGDNLDAIYISEDIVAVESVISAKIIGIMYFKDEGQVDDKIICSPIGSSISTIADIKEKKLDQLTEYYNHYKDYKKPGITNVVGWADKQAAIDTILNSITKSE